MKLRIVANKTAADAYNQKAMALSVKLKEAEKLAMDLKGDPKLVEHLRAYLQRSMDITSQLLRR